MYINIMYAFLFVHVQIHYYFICASREILSKYLKMYIDFAYLKQSSFVCYNSKMFSFYER